MEESDTAAASTSPEMGRGSVPLVRLDLEERFLKVMRRMGRLGNPNRTVADVLALDPEELGRIRGIGVFYVETLKDLQSALPNLVRDMHEPAPPLTGVATDRETAATRLDLLPLTPRQRRVVERLRSRLGAPETVNGLRKVNPEEFAARPGVGSLSRQRLLALKARIPELVRRYEEQRGADRASGKTEPLLLAELNLTAEDRKTLHRLETSSVWDGTVGSLMALKLATLRSRYSMTKREADVLRGLLEEVPGLFARYAVAREVAAGTSLNYSRLTPDERKLLARLSSRLPAEALEPRGLIGLDPAEILRARGVGLRSAQSLHPFVRRIFEDLYRISDRDEDDSIRPGLLVTRAFRRIPLEEIESLMIDDLEAFLLRCDRREAMIARSIWGYCRMPETLEELAAKLGVSRARVGQIMTSLSRRLTRSLSVAGEVLRKNLDAYGPAELGRLLPRLAGRFQVQHRFLALLGKLLGIPRCEARPQRTARNRAFRVLEGLFARTPAPVSVSQCLAELSEEAGESGQAAALFDALVLEKRMEVHGEIVRARALRSRFAMAHILLEFPDGLRWKRAVRIVNRRALCRSPLQVGDHGRWIADSDMIYLCGRGRYRHRSFLGVREDEMAALLSTTREALERSGRYSANLQVLYMENRDRLPVEYFDLRFVVSTHGMEHGLFFDGKSCSDTVALGPGRPRITAREAILEILADAGIPLSVPEIREKLVTTSHSIMNSKLCRLQAEGLVVRVERRRYTTSDLAFAGCDLDAVIGAIGEILTDSRRPVEADALQQILDPRFGWRRSKYWYLGAAARGAEGRGWRIARTLVSASELPFDGIFDAVRRVFSEGMDNAEGLRRLYEVVRFSDAVAPGLRNCLSRLRQGQGSPGEE